MENAQQEKTMHRCIQRTQQSLMQIGEEAHAINCIIDRVAYRDDKPEAIRPESDVKQADPQNMTELLERLQATSTNLLKDVEKLRIRIDKLF